MLLKLTIMNVELVTKLFGSKQEIIKTCKNIRTFSNYSERDY